MEIHEQLIVTLNAVTAWAAGSGGPVHVASDLEDMVTLLQEAPAKARAVIMFHREEKRGEFEESGMVDRFFWIAVAREKGLKLEPGANLIRGVNGGKPLFLLAGEVRQTVRGIQFDATTEVTPNYRGMEPLTVNGVTMTDVLRIEFSIGSQLDQVAISDPTNPLNLQNP